MPLRPHSHQNDQRPGTTMTAQTEPLMRRRFLDLSHPIVSGMTTYPGLPGPEVETYMGRQESRAWLAPGVSFHIGRLTMVANTGTYLDAPFHFHESRADVVESSPRATGRGPDHCRGRARLRRRHRRYVRPDRSDHRTRCTRAHRLVVALGEQRSTSTEARTLPVMRCNG